tara:strand:- start:89 stop:262 length:174 start_codon:yes stop_codon:yes gene_type:complete
MNFESAKYLKDDGGNNVSILVKLDGESWIIPLDKDNRHYTEILKLVEEGKLKIKDAE